MKRYTSIFNLFDRTKNGRRSKNRFKKRREEFVKTDVEQTSNNYESIGSPTKSNSARIPARMNNQIGTSVPHKPRNERRNVNQQRVRFTDPPLFSIDLPLFFIPREHEHDSSIRTKRNGCCYTLLRIQFNLWWPLPFVIVIIRRIESERLWIDPWKIDNSDRNIANNYLLFI